MASSALEARTTRTVESRAMFTHSGKAFGFRVVVGEYQHQYHQNYIYDGQGYVPHPPAAGSDNTVEDRREYHAAQTASQESDTGGSPSYLAAEPFVYHDGNRHRDCSGKAYPQDDAEQVERGHGVSSGKADVTCDTAETCESDPQLQAVLSHQLPQERRSHDAGQRHHDHIRHPVAPVDAQAFRNRKNEYAGEGYEPHVSKSHQDKSQEHHDPTVEEPPVLRKFDILHKYTS